ncbi:MAG: hypothetical protein GY862_03690 [Gammaproteobacteria bacterium]|nr:hypothetical protein [Gammaproteobacteria bacterium]
MSKEEIKEQAVEEQAGETAPAAPVPPPGRSWIHPPPKPRKSRWMGALFLFLLLMAGGGGWLSYHLWLQLQEGRQILADQTAQTGNNMLALQDELKKLQDEMQNSLLVQLLRLSEQQKKLESTVSVLYAKLRKAGDDDNWSIEEVSYLLSVAHQRLWLAGDVDAALAALEAADRRLSHIKDPGLFPVREQLAKDINHLRKIELPDIAGMSLRLADYANQVEKLPLLQGRRQAKPAAEEEPGTQSEVHGWRGFLSAVGKQIGQLAVIRYNRGADPGLLAPEQRYFLAQNLRLSLENARFALLRRDNRHFTDAVHAARDWLARYYDQRAPEVTVLAEDLARMQKISLTPALPDISKSLAALRKFAEAPAEISPVSP